jgi:L-alanine-DL-glutamate epimerase-like enolase superfamily enzyme
MEVFSIALTLLFWQLLPFTATCNCWKSLDMPHFEIEAHSYELKLANPFTIARGTKRTVPNVLVSVSANSITGYGEAGPNSRYDEDGEKVLAAIEDCPSSIFKNINSPVEAASEISKRTAPVQSARAALEMAWLDWWGKSHGEPLWERLEAPSNRTPPSSFTIGLDKIDVIQRKVEEAQDYPILKVKLGTDHDHEVINAVREVTEKPIRVDANEGWADLETAKRNISFLADNNIELVEQPMPSAMHKEMAELKAWSPLPLIADESFKGSENLEQIADAFHGINIKLMKTGGLVKARTLIDEAHKQDLQVMVGCMIESSLAISAGALIGTWADYADLDGFLLIKDDPFQGLQLSDQKEILLSHSPGLGVQPRG